MARSEFEGLTLRETFSRLGASEGGLTSGEAENRLERYGYNEVLEKRTRWPISFLKKFYGPVPILLELIAVICFALGELRSFSIIFALLVFNAIVSFIEERRADNSVELLKKKLSVGARVLRDGAWTTVQARELVPGDIIRIRIGDIIPADSKVIKSDYLEVNQSALTGESLPVSKGNSSMVYEGTTPKQGEAICVVVSTGYNTSYGETTRLVQIAKPRLHLEDTIMSIVKYLAFLDIAAVALIVVASLFFFKLGLAELLPFALVVLIPSVPVALPAAFTVSMALGTERLTKKSILVTKLNAIEEAAIMDVMCFDKTGTITKNIPEVETVVPLYKTDVNEVVRYACMASVASDQDPIDNAVIHRAKTLGVASGYTTESFTPFQPATKMSSAVITLGGHRFRVSKGAPSIIASQCTMAPRQREEFDRVVQDFSSRRLRTIAVARQERGGKGTMLGLIALRDQPRSDAKRLIRKLHDLGVEVKMLTGDNVAIAKEIARSVGIMGEVVDFEALRKEGGHERVAMIENASVFAGIYPEDKFTIVKALQTAGHRVGMTGDGINDAPALKQAEVGIAVSNATDVAKSAAGMVLVKNGIGVMVSAVEESRRIFARMVTYTIAKITRAIQIILFITLSFLLIRSIPLLAFELVILLFSNDIANITIATDEERYSTSPNAWNVRSLMRSSLILGFVLLLTAMAFVPLSWYLKLDAVAFQSLVLFMLVFMDNLVIFSLREHVGYMWSSAPSAYLLATSFAAVTIVALMAYFGILIPQISGAAIVSVMILGTVLALAFDVVKHSVFKRFGIVGLTKGTNA